MATLDDIYERSSTAHRYENYVSLCCPFHDDTHPSLFAYADGFHCTSCGTKGSLEKLADKLGGVVSVKKHVDYRSPWSRWLRHSTVQDVCTEAHRILTKFKNFQCYLQERKIADNIGQLYLGYLDGWYIFPIFDKDRNITGAVARAGQSIQEATGMRYCIPNGQDPKSLYVPSYKRIEKQSKIFLPFGIIDCITLYGNGLAAVTGTVGKKIFPESLDWIRKTIVVLPDWGEDKEAYQLACNLGWRGQVKRLRYEDDTKDPNDVFTHYGQNVLLNLLGV